MAYELNLDHVLEAMVVRDLLASLGHYRWDRKPAYSYFHRLKAQNMKPREEAASRHNGLARRYKIRLRKSGHRDLEEGGDCQITNQQ